MKSLVPVLLILTGTLCYGAQPKAKATTPKPAGEFSFLVMGDSRGGKPVEIPEVYLTILREANVLAPDCAVDAGDLPHRARDIPHRTRDIPHRTRDLPHRARDIP